MLRRSAARLALALALSGAALPTTTRLADAATPFERQRDALLVELRSRAGRPEQAATLAALLRLEEHLPPGALLSALRDVADAGRSDPLAAAQAGYRLALEEARRGEAEAAARRLRGLGLALLEDVWLVGPFDGQGRSGHGRVYPPELEGGHPSPGKRWPGKERDVGWRRVRGGSREGALRLDGLLRPDADAVAYVHAQVRSERRQAAALRVGTPGPVKIWLNGALVLDRDVVHPAALDQHAAPVELLAGPNVLVVKTTVVSGAWRLYLRLTEPGGAPSRGVTPLAVATPRPLPATLRPLPPSSPATPPAPSKDKGPARSGARPAVVHDLVSWAEQRAAALARTPSAHPAAALDRARLLWLTRAGDVDAKEGEAAAREAALAGPEADSLRAELCTNDEERRAAEEQVARAQDRDWRCRGLSELGDLARLRRRDDEAVRLWRAALAEPTCFPAALAFAIEEQVAGLKASALARLDRLPAEVRAVVRVRLLRARLLDDLGRRAEAEAERRGILALRRTDIDLLQDLSTAARQRGDVEEAARLLGEIVDLRPDLTYVPIEQARMLEGAARPEAALEAIDRAIERVPDEARLHEERGRLLARRGRVEDALAAWRRALELKPQNPALRRSLERLAQEVAPTTRRPGGSAELAPIDNGEITRLVQAGLAARPGDNEPSIVLLDRRVVRVHANGLAESFWHRLVQVRTEKAARDNHEFFVRYTPGQHEVEIRRAQIWRRGSGGELEASEATGRDDRDLSEPWYGLYYDSRAEVVGFEGLRPGDVLEVAYAVTDVSSENALDDYFGDLDVIGEGAPKRRWEYTLIGPASRTFYFNDPGLRGMGRDTVTRDGEVHHRFWAADVPRVEPESAMPGWAEVAPVLHVSTYKDWQEVGRWYGHLVDDQLTPDESVRRAAREATAGATTVEEKVRGVHRFVVQNTRYVGLEFGIHGYKPYKVTQVLARRFGDCKDKASLIIALLREVGIDAELVLLRTRRAGRVAPAPASLAVFDHAIAYVPALGIYIDGTAEFSGMRELPHQDQGVMALRLKLRGAADALLVETPVLPSTENRAHRRWSATLLPTGAGRVEEQVTITGQAAAEWREHYQTEGEQQERYDKVWSGRLPGAQVESVAFTGLSDRNAPVQARAVALAPRLAAPGGEGILLLPMSTREQDFVRSYARLSRRKHELIVAYPWQHEEDLVFRLPDGWHAERLLPPILERSRFGRFSLEARLEPGGRSVRVHSLVDVQVHRVAPADYAELRAFLRSIDVALAQRITVRRDE
jgi:tetratricopeptide (TPR) repeat protein